MNGERSKKQPVEGFSLLPLLGALSLALLTLACSQKMANQPKYVPLRPSPFFDNGSSARPLVEGTVARGELRDDVTLYTGRAVTAPSAGLEGLSQVQGTTLPPRRNPPMPAAPKPGGKISPNYSYLFPFPITREVLDRGQERFDIYCAVCHDRLGTGNGMVVQRGYRRPPSYHIERLRQAPVGYFFDVITNGFGAMPDYAAQVSPRDRWAIIAYIRALQLSQNRRLADLSAEQQQQLGGAKQ